MIVGQICMRDVDTIAPEETALDAARRMQARGVGTLVVVNDQNQPMGLVSDRDLVVRVMAPGRDAARTAITEAMSPMPTTVLEDSSIESALGQMRIGRMRRLPVVNGSDQLIGIVALDDILRLLGEEFSLIGGLVETEAPHAGARSGA